MPADLGLVVVTGAASGIGRAVAVEAALNHAELALLDVDPDGLHQTAQLLDVDPLLVTCDVADPQQVDVAFEQIVREAGPIRGLVANAGIEVNAPAHQLPFDAWQRVLAVNLTGAFLCCQQAITSMLTEGRGSIVCTSSPAAFLGFVAGGNAAYAASKGGLSAMVRSLAVDYAAAGIRVNAVVPGATDTPLLLAETDPSERVDAHDAMRRAASEQIPLRRMGTPEEVARAVVWLLGPDSSYTTGTHLVCDGGLMVRSANTF